jgi:hypothetical protein
MNAVLLATELAMPARDGIRPFSDSLMFALVLAVTGGIERPVRITD